MCDVPSDPFTVAWLVESAPFGSTTNGANDPVIVPLSYLADFGEACTSTAAVALTMSTPSKASVPPVATTRPIQVLPVIVACAPPADFSVPLIVIVTPSTTVIFAPAAIVTVVP